MEQDNQTVETTEQPQAEPAAKLETPEPTQIATPASEPPVEEWDKERAAATIKAQRLHEKELENQLKDYERLKAEEQKRLDAQLTETERLQKQTAELQAEKARLEADILRRDVIAETGLPTVFADRLKGNTQEELLADAQELLKLLPKQKSNQSVTNPNNASPTETEAQMRERLYGKPVDVFELKQIKANGGGVFWPDK